MNHFKNRLNSILLAATLFVSLIPVLALADEVPADLKDLAGQLGCQTKEECVITFQKDLDKNIVIARDLGVYDKTPEIKEIANSYKTEILDKLSAVQNPEELESKIIELARNLISSKPQLAKKFEIEKKIVDRAQIVVNKAKEAGVTFGQCQKMDPDTASIDLLRACAKLSKDKTVQSYIPESARKGLEYADKSLELKSALNSGKYQCGDNTLNGCGNFCMNPDQATRSAGIPQVCKDIARNFFGADGERQLEQAHSQVGQAIDFYNRRSKNAVFVTKDGKTLLKPEEIGAYMEQEGKQGNVEAVSAGMDFMVANGFVSAEDAESAKSFVSQIKQTGQYIDFDKCAKDPQSCQSFIPQDQKDRFNGGLLVKQIMDVEFSKEGLTAGPEVCQLPENGEACLRASKRALPQLEELASKDPNVRNIVNDIKRHIDNGDQGLKARKKAEEDFRSSGNKIKLGDQEFTDFRQVDDFCKINGQLCLAESAKKGYIDQDFAVEKYERSFEHNQRFAPPPSEFGQDQQGFIFPGRPGEFPSQGRPSDFPRGFSPASFNQSDLNNQRQSGQDQYNSPRPPYSSQADSNSGVFYQQQDFNFYGVSPEDKAKALEQFKQWLDNPQGPPPVPVNRSPQYDNQPPEEGQYQDQPSQPQREVNFPYFGDDTTSRNQQDVQSPQQPQGFLPDFSRYFDPSNVKPFSPEFDKCMVERGISQDILERMRAGYSDPKYDAIAKSCSSYYNPGSGDSLKVEPPVDDRNLICPDVITRICTPGEQPVYTNERCAPYSCQLDKTISPTPIPIECASDQWWDSSTQTCKTSTTVTTPCPSGFWWDGATKSCTSSGSCGIGQWWDTATQSCKSSTTGTYHGTSGQISRTWHFSDGSSQSSQILDRTDSEYQTFIKGVGEQCLKISKDKFAWKAGAGDSSSSNWQNFGIPDCSGSVTNTTNTNTAQSGCTSAGGTWDSASNYCKMPGSTYGNCTSDQWWDSSSQSCKTTATTKCASGQYWDGTACVTSSTDCGAGYYWNGSSCQTTCASGEYWTGTSCQSSTSTGAGAVNCTSDQWWDSSSQSCKTTSTTNYSSDPATACSQGGGTWDSNTKYCQMPETSNSAQSCGSGQYWDGTACVSSATSVTPSCSSDQWWDSSTQTCKTSTTNYSNAQSCGSGQYWNGSACVNTSSTDSPSDGTYSGATSVTTCSSDQYWNGSSCVSNTSSGDSYTPPPSSSDSTYTPPPSTDSSSDSYTPPTSTSDSTYTSPPSTDSSSDSYTPPPSTSDSYTTPPSDSSTMPASSEPTSFLMKVINFANPYYIISKLADLVR